MAFDRKTSENDENLVESPFVIDTEYEGEQQIGFFGDETAENGDFSSQGEVGFIIDDGDYEEAPQVQAEAEAKTETAVQPTAANVVEAAAMTEVQNATEAEVTAESSEEVQEEADEVDKAAEETEEQGQVNVLEFSDTAPQGFKAKMGKFFTKTKIIVFSCTLAVLLILAAGFFALSHYWRNGDLKMPGFLAATGIYQGDNFKYFDCITVNGINIGGLTKEQATKKIQSQMKVQSVNYDITVKYEDKTVSLNKDDFDYSIENDDALKQAKQYCIDIMKGKTEKKNKNYTVSITLSKECKEKLLEKVRAVIHKDVVNATIAKVDSEGLVFVEEENGYELDDEDFLSKLEKVIASGEKKATVTPKVKTVEPTIKKAELTENIEELASHSTTSTNNANGTANMVKAMNMCNGTVIEPGATWSFNATTGNSEDESAGWLPAGAYSGGYVVQSVGGGICQASTTIYVAAIYANLGVVERSAHAWQSAYAAAGFDATVDYRTLDLKLKNTSDYPIYLSCGASGRVLTCKIYGSKKNNFDKVEIFTETTARVPNEYFTVRTYRTVYLNGSSKTVALNNSKYSLKPQLTEEEANRQQQQQQQQPQTPSSSAPVTPSEPSSSSSTPPPSSSGETSSGGSSSDNNSSDDSGTTSSESTTP